MLTQWIRSFNYNGTLVDTSIDLQSEVSVSTVIPATTGYILVGQYFPFNIMFADVDVANTTTSSISIQYWGGSEGWIDARDVLDETSSSGKTFAKSGNIQFECDDNTAWHITEDTDESYCSPPPELSTVKISNLYWIKIKFSGSLSAGTKLKGLTYMFCDDTVLNSLDPSLSQYLTSWESGKTNWNKQSIIGSKLVVKDLQMKGLINNAADLYYLDNVYLATAYRTLAVIFNGLGGEKMIEKANAALKEYKTLVGGMKFNVGEGGQKPDIMMAKTGRLVR